MRLWFNQEDLSKIVKIVSRSSNLNHFCLYRVKGKHNAAYVGEDVGENDDVFLCSEPETSGENQ